MGKVGYGWVKFLKDNFEVRDVRKICKRVSSTFPSLKSDVVKWFV